MTIFQQEEQLIQHLLNYDLESFADKLGLIKKKRRTLTAEDAVKLLNLAEHYSRNITNNKAKEKCLLICGLIWEHRDPEWKAVPTFLIRILSRLGLMPTTKMIDYGYDGESDSFTSLGSLIDELYVTSYFIENEVMVGEEQEVLLSNFQKQMWEAIDTHSRLGISAPTSAGKSFVLVTKIADLLLRGAKEVVYIVPTLSLINQVTSDLRKTFKQYGITHAHIHQTYSDKHIMVGRNVFVLTQERAASAIAQKAFKGLDLLIVDEVQNVERVADSSDERAHTMYDTIMDFVNDVKPKKIVVSGPRIDGIDKFVKSIFGDEAESLSDDLPPVVNLTYSFSKVGQKVLLNQYVSLHETSNKLIIDKNDLIDPKLFGQQQYNEKMIILLGELIHRLETENSGTIVFSPTSNKASDIALELASLIDQGEFKDDLVGLSLYIQKSVHPNYSLAQCVERGIAYHHGKMPGHIRLIVEKAFSKLMIKTIVCTTTLMQGVNLPAKNIIARNPNLFTKKSNQRDNAILTGYEFANLRGRAGRLMKDFVGRAIILDESAFEESQINLVEYPQKTVVTGYGERFEENRSMLMDYLLDGEESSLDIYDTDLLVYVRQMILKYDMNSLPRMKKTGIQISINEFRDIKEQLNSLEVSKEICSKNWYWDPVVLNKIYNYVRYGYFKQSPKFPYDPGYVSTLCDNIRTLRSVASYYYNKHLNLYGEHGEKRLASIVINAQKWSMETRLKELVSWNGDPDSAGIDSIIATINKEVMYALPKLLKPLIQMQDETNAVLTYMEMGAYRPESRRLIEIGIPRETAINISKMMLDDKYKATHEGMVHDGLLFKYLNRVYDRLDYWEQVQVHDFISDI